jgi:type IV pilus assembly protein PilA
MLKTIKQRLGRDDEQGFTLIELMVVVLIIAILLAIAIPTFLGARNSANARGAQSNLRNALTTEKVAWTNNQAFIDSTATGTPTGAAQLAAIEPSLTWVTAAPVGNTPGNSVLATIDTTHTNTVVLTALGKDNNCYSIAQVEQADGKYKNVGTFYMQTALTGGATTCTPPTAPLTSSATAGSGSATNAGPDKASGAGNDGFWEASF